MKFPPPIVGLVVGLAVASGPALPAQSGPEALVGAWRYVGEADRFADGTPFPFMPDTGFAGLLIYTHGGRVSAQILPTGGASGITPDLLDLSTSYFGRYTVDWARQVVTHQVTANLILGPAVQTYQRRFRLEGNRLTLEGDWEYQGKPAVFRLTWERVE